MVRPTKAVQASDRQMPDRFAGDWGYFQHHRGRWVGEPALAPRGIRSNFDTHKWIKPISPLLKSTAGVPQKSLVARGPGQRSSASRALCLPLKGARR